jgi:hypothetical protein
MTIYLKLIHCRATPDQQMNDWGFDDPILGPFDAGRVQNMGGWGRGRYDWPIDLLADRFAGWEFADGVGLAPG